MYSNQIKANFINELRIMIDNNKYSKSITAIRLSLMRTASGGGENSADKITVKDEEIAFATHGGGPAN